MPIGLIGIEAWMAKLRTNLTREASATEELLLRSLAERECEKGCFSANLDERDFHMKQNK
jgi:hypothetical protein